MSRDRLIIADGVELPLILEEFSRRVLRIDKDVEIRPGTTSTRYVIDVCGKSKINFILNRSYGSKSDESVIFIYGGSDSKGNEGIIIHLENIEPETLKTSIEFGLQKAFKNSQSS